jgi:K+ transporter
MIRFFLHDKEKDKNWKRHIIIHVIGFILCVTILCVTVYEKFGEGGWATLVITSVLIGSCYLIKRHYHKVRQAALQLEDILQKIRPGKNFNNEPLNPREPTAIMLVSGFNGFGLHTWLSINRKFPHFIKTSFLYRLPKLIRELSKEPQKCNN